MTVPATVSACFRPRPATADKYSVGTVAVVGGCEAYPHAPVLAGLGARAAGAGLVRLVVPEASRFAAACHVPEATLTRRAPEALIPHADVTVAGMGLGLSDETTALVRRLVGDSSRRRLVFDADALTVLSSLSAASGAALAPCEGRHLVLTPHEGEAARLLGWGRARVAADRRGALAALVARYRATVVLKGARTLVMAADGVRTYENETGNPVLAQGGSGDLLAGILAARWAACDGDDPFAAAAAAVWLHGAAADEVVAEARDPSIVALAAAVGSIRVRLERCDERI